MAPVEGAWSQAEAESFLERALVPVRLGCHGAGGFWMVSLWYRYHEGAVECATASDSDLAAFLREEREEAVVRVDPARLYTWDFTPRMADLGEAPSVTRGEPTSPKYGHPGE